MENILKYKYIHIYLLLIIVFIVSYPTIYFEFVDYDDYLHLNEVKKISFKGFFRFWEKPFEGLYMPVSYNIRQILFFFSESIYGPKVKLPVIFHLYSVLNHAINIILVYFLLYTLSHKKNQSIVGSFVFGLHPLQVESFAWTSQIGILSGFSFTIISLYLFYKYLIKNNYIFYVLSLIFFNMSILSKPNYAVLPFIILILFAGKLRFNEFLIKLTPFFLSFLAIYIVTKEIQIDDNIYFNPDIFNRIEIAVLNIFFYINKFMYPFNLVPDYGIKFTDHIDNKLLFFESLILICFVLLAFKYKKHCIITGLLIFFIGLAPVLGLTLFSFQNISLVADRYIYMSIFGISYIISKLDIKIVYFHKIICLLVMILILFRTSEQINIWKDNPTLLRSILKINKRSGLAHNNLGLYYFRKNNIKKAMKHYSKAIKFSHRPSLAYQNRGNARMKIKDFNGAILDYNKVLKIKKNKSVIYYKRGISKEKLGFDGTKDIKIAAKLKYHEAKIWLKDNQ
jgi:tetratricopeptide (TPR) repeat protein